MIQINIAIIGATGLVGQNFIQALEEKDLNFNTIKLFTSKKSAGKEIMVKGIKYITEELNESSLTKDLDYAFFFASSSISEKYVPICQELGVIAIDNSSFFRMDKEIPLIVPEINSKKLKDHQYIIANPNCTTVQATMALKPLHDKFGLKRVIISTYQAVSGAGIEAVQDLENGTTNTLKYPIKNNLFPEIDAILENGYTKEEEKIINETRKILDLPNLAITATCVRVPVLTGHSESISIQFENKFELEEVIKTLKNAKGVHLENIPQPSQIVGKDEVLVGRIRRDESVENGLNIFVVADNLRKGAATNALQIMEALENERTNI
jgi:aspartate-semialdehyde dehydrogenase